MATKGNQLRLAGSLNDLFSHMVLWGLGAICADASLTGVRCHWANEQKAVPILTVDADAETVAQAVVDHAAIRAADRSWLHQTFGFKSGTKTTTIATMAPRTASPITAEDWHRLDRLIETAEEILPSPLDEAMLQGLGFRSWWEFEGKDMRPDRGCSPWEMRTRNRGMDVVQDRLLPLAVEVSGWSAEKVLAGLTGAEMDDAVGKNKDDSRSSTGFRLPGPVDNARAWCALWGISLLPLMPRLDGGSHAPAFARRRCVKWTDLHHLLMVAPAHPMPLARFARLQASTQLVEAASDAKFEDLKRRAAMRWLEERGATAILRFPVQVVGSTSAPERQTLSGQLVRVE